MKNLLLITIISIISTGRRIGSPLIFIKLLWWAPRRRRVMCLLSPWRKGVIISRPWSRWVWSVFFKRERERERERERRKIKKWKVSWIIAQEPLCQPSIPWPRTAPKTWRTGTRPPYMKDEMMLVIWYFNKRNWKLEFTKKTIHWNGDNPEICTFQNWEALYASCWGKGNMIYTLLGIRSNEKSWAYDINKMHSKKMV